VTDETEFMTQYSVARRGDERESLWRLLGVGAATRSSGRTWRQEARSIGGFWCGFHETAESESSNPRLGSEFSLFILVCKLVNLQSRLVIH
jgi:hypothetical protein